MASKEDNPWLPDDLTWRPGFTYSNLSGKPLPDWTPEEWLAFEVKLGLHAMTKRLVRDGYLDEELREP